MTAQSLADFARINNALKCVPKHLMHRYCRMYGIQSTDNARKSPYFKEYKLLSETRA